MPLETNERTMSKSDVFTGYLIKAQKLFSLSYIFSMSISRIFFSFFFPNDFGILILVNILVVTVGVVAGLTAPCLLSPRPQRGPERR